MSRSACKALLLGLAVLAVLPAIAGEGRTPIYLNSTTIITEGKYVVTRNILPTICIGPTITVQANDVEIDLNGMKVWACPGQPVIFAAGVNNLTIRNGTLTLADHGVWMRNGRKVVIEDVRIFEPSKAGIYLEEVTDFALRRNNIVGIGFPSPTVAPSEGIRVSSAGLRVSGTIEDNLVIGTNGGIYVESGSAVGILNNRLEEINVLTPARPGAIVYDISFGGLISENTIEQVQDGSGIYLGDSNGTKIYNNVVHQANGPGMVGIWLAGFSDNNLLLNNLVTEAATDGIYVEGRGNNIEQNLMNTNGISGSGHGLHFTPSSSTNTYGRNTARGNPGGPCAGPSTPDWCDEGPGNVSWGDNLMPGPPPF